MHIRLTDEARSRLIAEVQAFLAEDFDVTLSDFQAERLVDFLSRKLGAPVYNQAIQDARGFIQAKLDDLEGEFYEPEGGR